MQQIWILMTSAWAVHLPSSYYGTYATFSLCHLFTVFFPCLFTPSNLSWFLPLIDSFSFFTRPLSLSFVYFWLSGSSEISGTNRWIALCLYLNLYIVVYNELRNIYITQKKSARIENIEDFVSDIISESANHLLWRHQSFPRLFRNSNWVLWSGALRGVSV